MNFLKKIENKTLLIAPSILKNKILDEINKLDKLINIKIMSKEEFNKHYFFDYNEETIYYLTSKYQMTVKNAIIYLDNIKYVIDSNLENKNIIFLKEIYNDLIKNNLLKFDNLFKEYLKTVNIIVLNKEEIEPFYLNIFNNYQVIYKELETNTYKENKKVYSFKTIEEECNFVFNEISSLIKKGIPLNKIKLTNVCSEYIPFLKRFSYLYKINLNNLEKNSILATPATNKFLEMIENNKTKEEILEYITSNLDKEIFLSFFNIINHYYFVDSLLSVIDLIKEDLKNTYIKIPLYEDEIDIVPLNSYLINDDEYVFLLGFNLENLPKTYKDIDYLNDFIKQELGLFTSLDNNKLEHKKTLKHILNIKNLIISYKDTDPYKSYYPSNLIDELGLEVVNNLNSINQSSNLYNKIKLVNNLDMMLKYGTKSGDTSILLNTYKNISYLSYSNKYNGIKNFNLDKITLSYTSLNNYYHCSFRYYIDSILKLNIYEDSFKVYIGNLFHFVLSRMFIDNFDYEVEFSNYIKEKEFTKKEQFYLNILKEELKEIINIIRFQHDLSGLTKVKLETEISLNYQDNRVFKGIIDKIMYKEKDGNTYLSLIDYKTGTPKTDMTNLIYGIDMQLPTYAYLVKKSNLFLNPKVIGFYFEQILHEKSAFDSKKTNEEIKRDKLKLNGYTISDMYLVEMFDSSYLNSEMIKGMKVTSKGFSHYTKVIDESDIDALVNLVDLKIKEAFKEIGNANFEINPKVIGGENIGCSFCKYKDLCFKTGSDLVYLEKKNDLSYLSENN